MSEPIHPRVSGASEIGAASARPGIRSPKRTAGNDNGSRAKWFRYYAGFSAGFVEDAIDRLDLKRSAKLLDPWLGAGTTSEVAVANGYQIRGYDLNPAMLLVAKARLLASSESEDVSRVVESLGDTFEDNVLRPNESPDAIEGDPLEQWLQPASARAFRRVERKLVAAVADGSRWTRLPIYRSAGQVPPIVAFFYVGLFRTLRHFITKFQSSNPTWVKVSTGSPRIQLSIERIYNRFRSEIALLRDALSDEARVMPSVGKGRCTIKEASSTNLPLSASSVDAVLSSPPYCTRIDYVRATLPELAIIRFPNGVSIRRLREQMIGTPTISKSELGFEPAWGGSCNLFLSQVASHSSKASSSYYIKYFKQYFASAFASLHEIDRVLKDSGQCVLVVQDSYYKDILNDLPKIFCEMAQGLGWRLNNKIDFPVKRTFAGINPEVKPYRSNFQAVESALIFSKKI